MRPELTTNSTSRFDHQTSFASPVHWESLQNGELLNSDPEAPTQSLAEDVIERLEALDDVIFAAIDGDPDALDSAAATWQCTLSELGPETLEESRQQYLRFAKSVWEANREHRDNAPAHPFAAIEIIGILARVEQ